MHTTFDGQHAQVGRFRWASHPRVECSVSPSTRWIAGRDARLWAGVVWAWAMCGCSVRRGRGVGVTGCACGSGGGRVRRRRLRAFPVLALDSQPLGSSERGPRVTWQRAWSTQRVACSVALLPALHLDHRPMPCPARYTSVSVQEGMRGLKGMRPREEENRHRARNFRTGGIRTRDQNIKSRRASWRHAAPCKVLARLAFARPGHVATRKRPLGHPRWGELRKRRARGIDKMRLGAKGKQTMTSPGCALRSVQG